MVDCLFRFLFHSYRSGSYSAVVVLDGAGSARVGGVVSGFIFFFARFAPFFLFLALGKIARDDYRDENQFVLHTLPYVFFLPSGSYAGALLNLERPPQ